MANFCVECGSALTGSKKFCAQCGTPAVSTSAADVPSGVAAPPPNSAGAAAVEDSSAIRATHVESAQEVGGDSAADVGSETNQEPDDSASSKYSTPVRLQYVAGTSEKFWEAWIEGTTTYVRYGRIGTKGTTTINEFETLQKAEAAVHRKHQEKLRKGYEPS